MVSSLESVRNYLSLIEAREFRYAENIERRVPNSFAERVSNLILKPMQYPFDWALQNVKRPIFVLAINIVGVAAATLFFYPDQSLHAVQTVLSPFLDFETWMIRFSIFTASEVALTALMIRTLGRIHLLEEIQQKRVIPIHLGTETK